MHINYKIIIGVSNNFDSFGFVFVFDLFTDLKINSFSFLVNNSC